jgi:photosystem II stability/assembly factor-like uncharacterized protein
MIRKLTLKLAFLCLVVLFGPIVAHTQVWQPGNGPYGGDINCLTHNDSYTFTAAGILTNGKGVFRSSDNGNNWELSSTGFSSLPLGKTIYGMITKGEYIFASSFVDYENVPPLAGIYRSSDNGSNWEQLPQVFSNEQPPLAFATDQNAIVAGNPSGCKVSLDDGLTWVVMNSFPGVSGTPNVRALAFSDNYLYAGLSNGRIFRSANYGQVWTEHSSGLSTGGQVQSLISNGDVVFAGKTNGVFRLVGDGSSWTSELTGLPTTSRNVSSLAIAGDYIYAGGVLYASGIYRSAISGSMSWSKISNLLPDQRISTLYSDGINIFAGVASIGLYRSSDEGQNWHPSNNGLSGYNTLRYTPATDQSFYVVTKGSGSNGMIFSTNDQGNSFTPLGKISNYNSGADNAGPFKFNDLLFISHQSNTYRSINHGQTWEETGNGILPQTYAFYASGNTLFAGCGCYGGIHFSNDEGITWNSSAGITHPQGYAPTVLCIDGNENKKFAGTLNGLFVSVDGGLNWSIAQGSIPQVMINNLLIEGNTIIAGSSISGIYRSTDNGLTWAPKNSGLGSLTIKALASYGTTIYAGTPLGVFRSENYGDTWVAFNEGFGLIPDIATLLTVENTLITNNVLNQGEAILRRQLSGTAPSQPSEISGLTTPCIGTIESYSVVNQPGVTYSWQVPSGWSIISGANTNEIQTIVGANSGYVLVTAINGWGSSQARIKVVNPTGEAPINPGGINGPMMPEYGEIATYNVTLIPEVSYQWSIPADWTMLSGLNTNSITVAVGVQSGEISVFTSTQCGNSAPSTITVTAVDPLAPAIFTVTGSGSYCTGTNGLAVGLSGSEVGVIYTLYQDNSPLLVQLTGDGSSLNFGNYTYGTYTILATNTHMSLFMQGVATLAEVESLQVSVHISSDQDIICEGETVTFTAITENGGNATYNWFVNGEAIYAYQNEFSYSPQNGDVIYVIVSSDLTCAVGNPATSNSLVLQVNPITELIISIQSEGSLFCQGIETELIAISNLPESTTYNWFLNNNLLEGINGPTLSITPQDDDEVYVVATSTIPCIQNNTAISETIVFEVIPQYPLTVAISADATEVCSGSVVNITSSITNGGNATIQWYINDILSGSNTSIFSFTPQNNDVVYSVVTSDLACVIGNPATSNSLSFVVFDYIATSVSITTENTRLCEGSTVTVTAFPVNGGQPSYEWFVNDQPAGMNQANLIFEPLDGDMVFVVMSSDLYCATGNPATSNLIEFSVELMQTPVVVIEASENPVGYGNLVTFTATHEFGGQPSFEWYVNNLTVGNGSYYAYIPEDGDEIFVVMASSLECLYQNVDTSNVITVEVIVNVTNQKLTRNIELFPNPAKDRINISSSVKFNYIRIFGAVGNLVKAQSCDFDSDYATVELIGLKPGVYFLQLFNNEEPIGIGKLVVKN